MGKAIPSELGQSWYVMQVPSLEVGSPLEVEPPLEVEQPLEVVVDYVLGQA